MRIQTAWKFFAAVLAVIVVAVAGCGGNDSDQAKQAFEQEGSTATMPEGHPDVSGMTGEAAGSPNAVAGIHWTVPEAWMVGEQRTMRAATYMIAPVDGDNTSAECAVFYFGANQGGGIEANIDRWIGQFSQPDGSDPKSAAKTREMEVDGMKCHLVETSGTYTGAMGPMAGQMEPKEGFRMHAAIIEGPQGAVFFKLTGPDKTVDAAESDFETMIKSVAKD